ncbi:YigZ family protein [Komagataeibacter medellinensis]|uniref:YigZ family protein n=1 Tax=Komagataeibacter medellinensis TaxID=1177712 RepID=A0ABQ6VUI4_9PROT|nr:YigZ family protein [Komagataeibacter medellinensis]KAB8123869.1 YigZ family protein [Komagataeibacter medellinensis]
MSAPERFMLREPVMLERDIKKSIFLAQAAPVSTPTEAMEFIASVSDPDATHNCWAYLIGQTYRSDDAGEPGGTAGRPILQVIEGQGFDRTVVVVTRWFGGTKLGAGGLVRAYGGTAAECLRTAPRVPIVDMVDLTFTCGFSEHALLRARLESMDCQIVGEDFGAAGVGMHVALPTIREAEVRTRITDITRGQAVIRVVEEDVGQGVGD